MPNHPADSVAQSADTPAEPSTAGRWWIVLILALALAVRLGHLAAAHDAPFVADLVMDSQEYDRWAREIAAGDWIGSEIFFQAPLYPYTLAVIYAVTGGGPTLVYLLQILLAVAGCWALYRAGRVLVPDRGEQVGLAAALLAALYAPFVFYDVQLLKESFAVSLVCFLLWAVLVARRESHGLRLWAVSGALLGVLILMRENAMMLVPLLLLLGLLGRPSSSFDSRRDRTQALKRAAVVALGVGCALAPVALRNGLVGGAYLPTTFNSGIVFYIGNNAGADGTYQPVTAGKQIPRLERSEPIRVAEQDLGRDLTDSEVSRYWLDRSLDWIRAEPLDFLQLQVHKLGLYWRWNEWPDAVDYAWMRERSVPLGLLPVQFGTVVLLACWGFWTRRRHLFGTDLPLLLWIAGWTASTVLFFVFSRYRIPMMPALMLWAALPVSQVLQCLQRRDLRRAAPLLALCLVAVVLPRWTDPEPREDLVHYNLGVIHRDAGRPEEAEAEFRRALDADPDYFQSHMNLALLLASRNELDAAAHHLQRAATLEPRSDDAVANLGALYLRAGRFDDAERHLRRALAINPDHGPAQQNLELLARLRARVVAQPGPSPEGSSG